MNHLYTLNQLKKQSGKTVVKLLDNKFALHMYTEHYFSFDCDHCGPHYPDNVAMFKIHLKMCKAPCNGHSHCPCNLLAT